MCGIVGLYFKNPELESNLGTMLSDMLLQMTDRGPDSAGVALYHDVVGEGKIKITLQGPDDADWNNIRSRIDAAVDGNIMLEPLANHAVVILDAADQTESDRIASWIETNLDDTNITSLGSSIEIFKEKGLPAGVIDKFALRSVSGTHALGHTRMATESAVTTEHSHPFSTGLDLCLVHNGSLSNHNQLRENLQKECIVTSW